MAGTNNADRELGHQLVNLTDDQLEMVLDYAANVPWQTRKLFMLAVATDLYHSNCCHDGPDHSAVLAACQHALITAVGGLEAELPSAIPR